MKARNGYLLGTLAGIISLLALIVIFDDRKTRLSRLDAHTRQMIEINKLLFELSVHARNNRRYEALHTFQELRSNWQLLDVISKENIRNQKHNNKTYLTADSLTRLGTHVDEYCSGKTPRPDSVVLEIARINDQIDRMD